MEPCVKWVAVVTAAGALTGAMVAHLALVGWEAPRMATRCHPGRLVVVVAMWRLTMPLVALVVGV